jgi:nitroreductase
VHEKDFKQMIEIAKMAPSGSNSQPWHFIWIRSPKKIKKIGKIVTEKLAELQARYQDVKSDKSEKPERITGLSFFAKAPSIVCVLRGKYKNRLDHLLEYTDPVGYEIRKTIINPSLQSVAAATTTFLLAADILGYGACWMTGPLIAKDEIENFLKVEEPFELVALIPLGLAKKIPSKPKRKPFKEIVTIIK